MTTLELKDRLVKAKDLYTMGKISIDDLYAAADAYIDALREYKKRTGKKFAIPSRGYLIRAF